MALLAEVQLPEPHASILVVSVHLENKASAECRNQQMEALINRIDEIETQAGQRYQVIVGGDMNPVLGSAGPLKELWTKRKYRFDFNKGSTFGPMRLDYIVTRSKNFETEETESAFRAINGATLNEVKTFLRPASDHTPIWVEVPL